MTDRWDKYMFYIMMMLALATNISTALASTAIVLGLILMLVQYIVTRKLPVTDKGFLKVIGMYVLLQCIIAAASYDPKLSFGEVFAEAYRFSPLFFALMYIRSLRQVKYLIGMFMVSVFADNVWGAYQYFVLMNPRPAAFNSTATYYACFLLMAIPVLYMVLQKAYFADRQKTAAAFLLVLCLIMLICCGTRGGWVAFVGMILLWGGMTGRSHRKKMIAILGSICIVSTTMMATWPYFHDRVISIIHPKDVSANERFYMWESATNMTRDHLLLGVGQGNFQYFYNTQYIHPKATHASDGDITKGFSHPHNNFWTYTSEGGLVGMTAFLMLYGYIFWRLGRCWWLERDLTECSCGLMGILILLGLHLEGLTDTNLTQVPIMRTFWFLCGMLLVASKLEQSQDLD